MKKKILFLLISSLIILTTLINFADQEVNWMEMFKGEPIPVNGFQAYYFNMSNSERLVSSETVDCISLNYTYSDFLGIDSEHLGVYYVGYIESAKGNYQIDTNFSWSEIKVSIDHQIVYEGEYSKTIFTYLEKGKHLVEVEYKSHYFSTNLNVTISPKYEILTVDEAKQIYDESKSQNSQLYYANIYTSSNLYNQMNIELSKSSKPITLLLSSYGATQWNISNPSNNKIESIFINSVEKGATISGVDASNTKIYYIHSYQDNYDGESLNSNTILGEADSVARSYSCNYIVMNTNSKNKIMDKNDAEPLKVITANVSINKLDDGDKPITAMSIVSKLVVSKRTGANTQVPLSADERILDRISKYNSIENDSRPGLFKKYIIDMENPETILSESTENCISANYERETLSFKPNHVGFYWVGNIDVQSDYQFMVIRTTGSKTKVWIDGYPQTIPNNSKTQALYYGIKKGIHKIEVESTSIFFKMADVYFSYQPRVEPSLLYRETGDIVRNKDADTKIWHVNVYKSSEADQSVVVDLKASSEPVILILASHDLVNWKINNPYNVEILHTYYGAFEDYPTVSGVDGPIDNVQNLYCMKSLNPMYSDINNGFYYLHYGMWGILNNTRNLVSKLDGVSIKECTSQISVPEITMTDEIYSGVNANIQKLMKAKIKTGKATDQNVHLKVNKVLTPLENPFIFENNRLYVPVKDFFDKFGGTTFIDYTSTFKTVKVRRLFWDDERVFTFYENQKNVKIEKYYDDVYLQMEKAAFFRNGQMYIAASVLGELIEADSYWNDDEKTFEMTLPY